MQPGRKRNGDRGRIFTTPRHRNNEEAKNGHADKFRYSHILTRLVPFGPYCEIMTVPDLFKIRLIRPHCRIVPYT